MKKKIFDLNDKEELKLMRDLIKTTYGRQYFMLVCFVVFLAILSIILFIFLLIMNFLMKDDINYILILLSILFIFILLGMSLFAKMKWMNLLKDYFDFINDK